MAGSRASSRGMLRSSKRRLHDFGQWIYRLPRSPAFRGNDGLLANHKALLFDSGVNVLAVLQFETLAHPFPHILRGNGARLFTEPERLWGMRLVIFRLARSVVCAE